MKKLYSSLFLILVLLLVAPEIFARSGCCSHHGGVCGCGCCDGTSLSAKCAPYYPECNSNQTQSQIQEIPVYIPPTRTIMYPTITRKIPFSVKGKSAFILNKITKRYDLKFDWDDIYSASGYSIGLSKVAGANPGPVVDTTKSEWLFRNVGSGRLYVNLKAKLDGSWSKVRYWDVYGPSLPTSTPIKH